MSIEQYYSHIISYPYVDVEFYKTEDVNIEMLKSLGISEQIATGLDKTNGEYHTGNPGRQPEWNTYQGFRWKLSLDKLDAVLEYISSHPKAPDSMAKSSFIFRFLQNHESMLSGTVYVGGSTPNIPNTYSDIVMKLRQEGPRHRFYGMQWDGKWLFTESCELVSQKEISKADLHPQLYGNVRLESKLYEILGFVKSKEELLEEKIQVYDRLDDETKNQFLEIELRRRFGISVTDLENNYGNLDSHEMINTDTSIIEKSFEFPTSRVKNWDSLRKHVAEVLVFANPVKYEYKIRRIRVSRPETEIVAYLRSMYRIDGSYRYACQMCHKPVASFEKCQISSALDTELDAMYLCLCPNCASEYRKMRKQANLLNTFISRIRNLDEQIISSADPVRIPIGNESIWFTQTHIAEVKELMDLKNRADNSELTDSKIKLDTINNKQSYEDEDNDYGEVSAGIDVYKEYIGKRVLHEYVGYGVVRWCDGKYIGIEFEKGEKKGKIVKYSLEACLSKDMIHIV